MKRRANWLIAGTLASAPAWLGGCSDQYAVTGKNSGDPTWQGSQSETSSASAFSGGQSVYVVAFNDDTADGKITYTDTDRVVFPGASLLGWSYSFDHGIHWTYGGKVKPPEGIGALWGDPAIIASRTSSNRVYISSLSINAANIPAAGFHGFVNSVVSGACVARSDDAGIHFAIQSCFTSNNDFYDGGDMAAGGGGDPRIFTAYVDVPHDRIDVWASPDGVAPFVQLPDPFPGMTMVTHPHLAYDQSTGALLVAAIANDARIYLNRLVGNSWQTPVLASNPTTGITVAVGSQTIRAADGFSFDVGAPSQIQLDDGGVKVFDDDIRMLYTTRDSTTQRLYVRGSACRFDLTNCHDMPQWGTTPGNLNTPRDQWNPSVAAWPGFIGLPPVWKATYQTTDDDPNKISIKQGNLVVLPDGVPVYLPFDLVPPRPICPDLRGGAPGHANNGYWGDYDQMRMVGFSSDSTSPFFLQAFSDSSAGCVSQAFFTSNHLHVGSVAFQ